MRAAVERLDPNAADVLAIASPHGPQLGIYREISGHLGGFGLPEISATAPAFDLWADVPGSEGVAIDRPIDHGIVVPLRLMKSELPVMALAAADPGVGNSDECIAAAKRAAGLIKMIATNHDVVFVASVNTSACLSSRSPYPTEVDEGSEARLVEILQTDLGLLREEAPAITERAHSCALAPLLVLGHLFRGRKMEVLAHEAPVGVGYVVAQVT